MCLDPAVGDDSGTVRLGLTQKTDLAPAPVQGASQAANRASGQAAGLQLLELMGSRQPRCSTTSSAQVSLCTLVNLLALLALSLRPRAALFQWRPWRPSDKSAFSWRCCTSVIARLEQQHA